jgi:hypothetical protein
MRRLQTFAQNVTYHSGVCWSRPGAWCRPLCASPRHHRCGRWTSVRRPSPPDLRLRPLTPYGATKAACEIAALGRYSGSYKRMATAAQRFHQRLRTGMSHTGQSFVPGMMRAALTGPASRVTADGDSAAGTWCFLDDVVSGRTARAGDTKYDWARDHRIGDRSVVGARDDPTPFACRDRRSGAGRAHRRAPAGEMPAVRRRHPPTTLGYAPDGCRWRTGARPHVATTSAPSDY